MNTSFYIPQVNDYVKWNNNKKIRGWVYYKGHQYITIEMSVRPKNHENFQACCLHANDRLLILCYSRQWHELTCVKKRTSKHET
jgi:hypothetical protein